MTLNNFQVLPTTSKDDRPNKHRIGKTKHIIHTSRGKEANTQRERETRRLGILKDENPDPKHLE